MKDPVSGKPLRLRISALDAVDLLGNVYYGANIDEVGFEDMERGINDLARQLSYFKYYVDADAVQSALWSCNLMNEEGRFYSARGEEFDKFVARLMATSGQAYIFDKRYNLIVPRPKKPRR